MIRVLHLSRNSHPFVGGTETFIASLARHTAPLGVESSIVCSTRHADGAGPPPEIPVLRVATIGPEQIQAITRISAELRALVARADVLHFHDLRFGLDLLGRMKVARATPRVLSTHGLIFHTPAHERLKALAWRALLLPTLRRFDAIIADSAADYTLVSDLPRARMIENPVEVDTFLTVAASPIVADGPLLCFGRVAPNKGLDRLAPVLQRDPTQRLVVVGTGEVRDVDELARRFAGLPARFAGARDEAGLQAELRGCSAIVLPSRTEGFGLTLVEAMATGRPVVAADIVPYRAIAEGTGVPLVDFDDPEAVVDALRRARAASDPAPRLERARSYSWDTRAPELVAVYDEVVSGRADRAHA